MSRNGSIDLTKLELQGHGERFVLLVDPRQMSAQLLSVYFERRASQVLQSLKLGKVVGED